MLETVVIRPLLGRVVAVVIVAAVAVGVVSLAISRPEEALRVSWILLLIGSFAWITLWLPSVRLAEDAVTVRNVFTTIRVPWATIEGVDTKWAMTLQTEQGDVVAWAAPAPGRHSSARMHSEDAANLPASAYLGDTVRPGDVPRSDSGDAATIIRLQLERLRDDLKDDGAGAITRSTHRGTIAVIVVLLVTAIVAAFA